MHTWTRRCKEGVSTDKSTKCRGRQTDIDRNRQAGINVGCTPVLRLGGVLPNLPLAYRLIVDRVKANNLCASQSQQSESKPTVRVKANNLCGSCYFSA